jgi:hypothetical protein
MNFAHSDEIEQEIKLSEYHGRASSLEEAEYEATQRSGVAYAAGKDEEAKHWRMVAVWLGEKACEERKKQKRFQSQPHGGVS